MSYMNIEEVILSYPVEDRVSIREWFSRKTVEHECDCMDSERVALVGDKDAESDFDKMRSCCGCDEDEIVAPSGAKYLVGCNYGH